MSPPASIAAEPGFPLPTRAMKTSAKLARVVPKNNGMNKERRIVELIELNAATACDASIRPSAGMTNVENAK